MWEKGNNIINAIDINSEEKQNISENEWKKISEDKSKIFSNISDSELKIEFESKYKELEDEFNKEWEQIHITTNEELKLFKNIFILDKFWVWKEVKDSIVELDSIGLDLIQLLSWYDNYIETELKDLPKEIKDKIKKSLSIKLKSIPSIIEELKVKWKNEWMNRI